MKEPTTTALDLTTGEKVPVRMGIVPTTLEKGWRLAQAFAASDLVPQNFRGKPEDVLVAIQMGMEIGFAPMQALQSIAVINGRPGVWGDGLLALIMASPLYGDHDEYFEVEVPPSADDVAHAAKVGLPTPASHVERRSGLVADDLKKDTTGAVCTFARRGLDRAVRKTFTIGHAKKAVLWTKPGPWQQYPDRMLQMRARSFAARDLFPDLLRGITAAEELLDVPPAAVSVGPVVRRLSETPTPPAEPDPPTVEVTTLEPARVAAVAPFLDGAIVTLSTGVRVTVLSDADVRDLRTFIGRDDLLRLTVRRGAEDELLLQSFGIAD